MAQATQSPLERSYAWLGVLLIAPTVLVFCAVIVYPLVSTIYLSLFSIYTPTLQGDWVGLANYRELLAKGEFWSSLRTNIVWTVGTLTLQIVFGVGMALILHQNLMFRALARSLILFPYFASTVVAVLVWRWLFNDLYGILNHFAMLTGTTDMPVDWLGSMPNALLSVILALSTTFVVVSIGTLGAYSPVRYRYRGRESLAFLVLFTYLLPSVVLIIPPYLMMVNLGLSNTIFSLVIAYTTFALPYALWLLRSFMAGIPEDLESAALVDGASRMGAFFDVILPQLLPGVISTALFTFILSWNEYLYALVLVNSDSARPLTIGVMTMLMAAFNIEWSLLMAASVMMSLPLIVVFAFLQSYLTRGFGAGAVKG